ncbi:unnamed protein product [Echinostoma caproni]|uniref:Endo/exonuclease/phosphatase domain-containing protein n=1 Tax=Echinostoma caproni TaxID=27848 RepID=A0A183AYU9_9TREM|nr:unnamed protein product [Echinostoma caproni]
MLLLGDLNVSEVQWAQAWAPRNTFGHRLLDWVQKGFLVQHFGQPTRWKSGQEPGLLDFVFARYPYEVEQFTVEPPLGRSDHEVIHFRYVLNVPKAPHKMRRVFRRIDCEALVVAASNREWQEEHEMIEEEWGPSNQEVKDYFCSGRSYTRSHTTEGILDFQLAVALFCTVQT